MCVCVSIYSKLILVTTAEFNIAENWEFYSVLVIKKQCIGI